VPNDSLPFLEQMLSSAVTDPDEFFNTLELSENFE
jgi:hypothetical protein